MKRVAQTVVALTSFVCIVALVVGIYPGVLVGFLGLFLLFALLLSPIAVPVVLIALGILVWKGRWIWKELPWKHAILAAALLGCTYVLLKFYVPRRIAFLASRHVFERFIDEDPFSNQRTRVDRFFGVVFVDEFAVDDRGGVYFRTYTAPDGLGPDVMSYGFVYQPNHQGTPFGAANYGLFRLGSDWYWFRASDDWY